ncbi:SLC13 family permease [Spongisporangium articulatum]|uniref:SLC13 family permease n=1 Tax=Spongisporangium articulatum TaxID=3362603 RepID=A0ABW8AIV6_9ACTN
MSLQAWLAVAVFASAYVLIATEWVHRLYAALGGAAAMVLIGAATSESAFFSEESGIDWNVVFLLLGMMIIVGVLRQTGVFQFLAIWAAKRARGRPYRVLVLLLVITAVASALLDNVTTVLLIAPVTLLICERLGLPPVPFLIAEAMASNVGGTATLIGDPPNIIIASRSGLSFNDFVLNLAPLVVILMIVFVLLSRVMFRSAFRYDPERVQRVMALEEREAITDPKLLVRVLVVLAFVLAGFTLHSVIHLEPSVVALLGAGAAVVVSRLGSEDFLAEVEWETLVFFMGLFVMVGGLVHTGVIEELGRLATDAVGDHYLVAATGLLFGSAVLSGIVDNIPYVATMAPLVADLVEKAPPGEAHALWWALALGADLGGNATAVGASANVVVTGIAARNGHPISFWQFTKYGLVVTAVTVTLCWPYLWLRYFVLGG